MHSVDDDQNNRREGCGYYVRNKFRACVLHAEEEECLGTRPILSIQQAKLCLYPFLRAQSVCSAQRQHNSMRIVLLTVDVYMYSKLQLFLTEHDCLFFNTGNVCIAIWLCKKISVSDKRNTFLL